MADMAAPGGCEKSGIIAETGHGLAERDGRPFESAASAQPKPVLRIFRRPHAFLTAERLRFVPFALCGGRLKNLLLAAAKLRFQTASAVKQVGH